MFLQFSHAHKKTFLLNSILNQDCEIIIEGSPTSCAPGSGHKKTQKMVGKEKNGMGKIITTTTSKKYDLKVAWSAKQL